MCATLRRIRSHVAEPRARGPAAPTGRRSRAIRASGGPKRPTQCHRIERAAHALHHHQVPVRAARPRRARPHGLRRARSRSPSSPAAATSRSSSSSSSSPSLRRAGLLRSQRGVKGGYSFARDPSEITVLEVVELLDGPLGGGAESDLRRRRRRRPRRARASTPSPTSPSARTAPPAPSCTTSELPRGA